MLARATGVNISGFGFVELPAQVTLAALGVALVAGTAGRRHRAVR